MEFKPLDIVNHRYELRQEIGRGSMGIVYQAYDRLNDELIALKLVLVDSQRLITDSIGSSSLAHEIVLAREFQLLASLRHPHIISVLDYGFHNGMPYYTMTLLQEKQEITTTAQAVGDNGRFTLIIQMLQALAYLHRRGVTHRDVKPGNILVNEQGQVKVLDFGLALENEEDGDISGTMGYIAPELLRGQSSTPRADLYSVGALIWQMFDPHALDGNAQDLLNLTLNNEPDLTAVPATLRPVVARLLAKDPQDRFAGPNDVIIALCEATQRPLPSETEAIRESFLQAATFVGRENELTQLLNSLEEMIEGNGNAWLIAGESGVGKSRLLEEIRARALVRGALTLRGQAVTNGNNTYQLWNNALRRLCLHTELTDLEAGVIRPLVPDVSRLIGRPVPDVPELDGEATVRRLLTTIESIFHKQEMPIVLLMEDLHWAATDLEILRHLTSKLTNQAIMVIGTYRDDEQPDLHQQLTNLQSIKLHRFDRPAIEKLSTSMLGGRIGRKSQIIDLLIRETEGNAFFLIEVVRALAEEAGQLNQVGQQPLPKHVFAEGITTIINRRLGRVPAEAFGLLKVAAIRGRQIDLNLLASIAPTTDMETWLLQCNNAAVLEFISNEWLFAHNKLRETILTELPSDEAQQLHEQVAQTLETLHPDDPVQAPALASHWAQAGNQTKEAHYLAIAGKQSLDTGAKQQAITQLQRAIELNQQLHTDKYQWAYLSHLLGEAYLSLGDIAQSYAAFTQAAKWLDAPLPEGGAQIGWGMFISMLRQLRNRVVKRRPSSPAEQFRYDLILQVYTQIAAIAVIKNDTMTTFYSILAQVNAGDRVLPSPEQAVAYASMALGVSFVRQYKIAEVYKNRAIEVIEAIEQSNSKKDTSYAPVILALYEAGSTNWEAGWDYAVQSINRGERVGNYWTIGGALNTQGMIASQQGYFQQAQFNYQQLLTLSRQQENRSQQGWALANQASMLLRLGGQQDYKQCLAYLAEALEVDPDITGTYSELNIYASQAVAHYRLGQLDEMWTILRKVEPLLKLQLNNQGSYQGLHDMVLLCLWLWEGGEETATAVALAKQSLSSLKSFAKPFPVARPLYQLALAWEHWLEKRPDKTWSALERGRQEAQTVRTIYTEGIICFHHGRFLLDSDKTAGQAHLQQALKIFDQLGTTYAKSMTELILLQQDK